MATFKYTGTDPLEIPALGIHISEGQTFEVPDEYAGRFEADELFKDSRTKNPDVVTGPIPVVAAPSEVPAA